MEYRINNKCPNCGTEIISQDTEDIKAVCTKWNCKTEFQKTLIGIIGVTIVMNENKHYVLINEEGQKSVFPTWEDLQRELNFLEKQTKITEEGEIKND